MLRYLLLVVCSVALSQAQCPSNAVYYSGSDRCFLFNSNEYTWDGARSYCQSQGGDLASIHNSGENSFLFNYWLPRYVDAAPWLGLKYVNGSYQWSDRSLFNYSFWYNTLNPVSTEQCTFQTFVSPGYWNTYYCNGTAAVLCSVPKVGQTTPKPSPTPTYCLTGYSYNGKCYNPIANATSWENARSQCLMRGGDLVSIHSAGENQYLASVARSFGMNGFWTGLNRQLDGTSNYTWSDGSTYNYNAFSPTVPGACANGAQDCVSEDTGKVQWFNCWACTHPLPFICELNTYSSQASVVVAKEKPVMSLAQRMNLKRLPPRKPATDPHA